MGLCHNAPTNWATRPGRQWFLKYDTESTNHKRKSQKTGLHKKEKPFVHQALSKKWKWKKILRNNISEKGLVSRMDKEFSTIKRHTAQFIVAHHSFLHLLSSFLLVLSGKTLPFKGCGLMWCLWPHLLGHFSPKLCLDWVHSLCKPSTSLPADAFKANFEFAYSYGIKHPCHFNLWVFPLLSCQVNHALNKYFKHII